MAAEGGYRVNGDKGLSIVGEPAVEKLGMVMKDLVGQKERMLDRQVDMQKGGMGGRKDD